MTRAFKIYNSLGYAIDILADLNTFGYSPEGLGVQFDNTTVNDGASFLLTKQELAMTDFKIKISFGAINHKAYQAYSEFIDLLNYPPYTLEYTTAAGSWKREMYLTELTKTELTVEDTLQEEFSAQPVTPWYRETTAESGLSDTQDGDGKIYIGNDFKNRIFEGVPTSGYRKGDLWHNVETTTVPSVAAGNFLGDQGIQGPKGLDGKSSYTHIAYATSSTGEGFSQTPTATTTHVGMYVDQTATDSTDPSKYKWTLIKGADGSQGTPGKAGADGKTPYLHTAYSWSADGTDRFTTIYPRENLLTNTSDFSYNWYAWSGQLSISKTMEYNGYPSMVLASSSGPQLSYQHLSLGTLNNSTKYTASFWAKADNVGDKARTELWGSIGATDFVLTADWVRYTTVLTSKPDVNTNISHCIYFVGVPGGNKGNVYIALPKLGNGSLATPYTPSPLDDPEGAYPKFIGTYTDYTADNSTDPSKYTWASTAPPELGYYKALKDNSSFWFYDWTFIGASISDLTYNSAYDYVYQNNSGSGKLGSTKSSGYVYDYIYEETPQNGGGIFGLKNNSIYMGINTGSPLNITIYGPSTNPYWQVIQNSQVVATDGFNIVIPEDSRLEVSSNPRDQYAYLISADGTKAKAYPMQDLTRDNFVKAPIGQSTLAVYNAKRIKIVLREERLIV